MYESSYWGLILKVQNLKPNKKFQLLITVEGTQILEFREDSHCIVAEKRVGEDSVHIMLDVKDCWVLGEGDCLLFISLVEIRF